MLVNAQVKKKGPMTMTWSRRGHERGGVIVTFFFFFFFFFQVLHSHLFIKKQKKQTQSAPCLPDDLTPQKAEKQK
jgi:hypothetical protein